MKNTSRRKPFKCKPPEVHFTIRSRVPYNKQLTNRACSSRTGEYWPLVVAVQTSLRSVRTATTSGQYSPVRPSRLVSKRLIFFLIPFLTSTLTFLLLCNRRLLKLYTFSDNVTSKHQYTPSKKLAENAQSGLSKKKKKKTAEQPVIIASGRSTEQKLWSIGGEFNWQTNKFEFSMV